MNALKMFSGGGGGGMGGAMGGSGNTQSKLIGVAMSEASKLFDSQPAAGNVASGVNKQSAITSAAEMAVKMMAQGGGSSGAGGMSGILGMASKFF